MNKKVIMAATISLSMITNTIPVMANPLATGAVAMPEAVRIGYEQSVIQRMIGRAGAATKEGAKGIVHELIYCDKLNAADIFKKGTKTSLTKSSTATQVDVITTNAGKTIARYQLKDTAKSIGKTLNQVASGKYNQAQLIGTKETVAAYNAKAASKGITKVMKSSGISSETTAIIAEKAINKAPSVSKMTKVAGKTVKAGATVNGAIVAAESIYRGDDFSEATGHIAVEASAGAISLGAGTVAAEVASAGVLAAGVSGAASVAVPAAILVGTAIVTEVALEKVNDNLDTESKISQSIDDTNEKYKIDKKISDAAGSVKNGLTMGVDTVREIIITIRK